MSEKYNIIEGRIQHKNDIEANWKKAVNFIPLEAEIVVYLPDEGHKTARIKVGDGITNVNDLPFSQEIDGALWQTGNSVTNNTGVAFGGSTQAGILGYYFSRFKATQNTSTQIWSVEVDLSTTQCKGLYESENTSKLFTLTAGANDVVTPPTSTIPYSEGDVLTLLCDYKLENAITVTSVNANTVYGTWTSEKSIFNAKITTGDINEDEYSIYCIAKPKAGEVPLGYYAHAEGWKTQALEKASHAEGRQTIAWGRFSHAEGRQTEAGHAAHSEGRKTKAQGDYAHAEGYDTNAAGQAAHAEGYDTNAAGQAAHAEGYNTMAGNHAAHAEGYDTNAAGQAAHAEGWETQAAGQAAHAEGSGTNAAASATHAEGYNTMAGNHAAHAEGKNTTANGRYAHAEGSGTNAAGEAAHAEGGNTTANDWSAHAEGYGTNAAGDAAHAEGGNTTANGWYAHAEGARTIASGYAAHAEGQDNISGSKAFTIKNLNKNTDGSGTYILNSVQGLKIGMVYSAHVYYSDKGWSTQSENYGKITGIDESTRTVTVDKLFCEYTFGTPNSYIDSDGYDNEFNTFRIITNPELGTRTIGAGTHAEGMSSEALSKGAHAEGYNTLAQGSYSHAEGQSTTAAFAAHAEGKITKASGFHSHAEGHGSTSSGEMSHAEGSRSTASGEASHAEGTYTTAAGNYSHAEGDHTTASGEAAHAEGFKSVAKGEYSHAEGSGTTAAGSHSHVGGSDSKASYSGSFVHGTGLNDNEENQTVIGKYNASAPGATFVVGNGTTSSNRSNAFVIYNDGSADIKNLKSMNVSSTSYDTKVKGFKIFEINSSSLPQDYRLRSYILETWAKVDQVESLLGVSAGTLPTEWKYYPVNDNNFNIENDLHAIIYSNNGTTINLGKVQGFYPTSSDWSKVAVVFDYSVPQFEDFISDNSHVLVFTERPDVGSYENLIPQGKSVIGDENKSAALNGLVVGTGLRSYNEGELGIGTYNDSDGDNLFSIGNGTSDEDRSNVFVVKKDGNTYINNNLYIGGTGNSTIAGDLHIDGNLTIQGGKEVATIDQIPSSDNFATSSSMNSINRRVDILESTLLDPSVISYIQDSETAIAKAVPENSLPYAQINSIGLSKKISSHSANVLDTNNIFKDFNNSLLMEDLSFPHPELGGATVTPYVALTNTDDNQLNLRLEYIPTGFSQTIWNNLSISSNVILPPGYYSGGWLNYSISGVVGGGNASSEPASNIAKVKFAYRAFSLNTGLFITDIVGENVYIDEFFTIKSCYLRVSNLSKYPIDSANAVISTNINYGPNKLNYTPYADPKVFEIPQNILDLGYYGIKTEFNDGGNYNNYKYDIIDFENETYNKYCFSTKLNEVLRYGGMEPDCYEINAACFSSSIVARIFESCYAIPYDDYKYKIKGIQMGHGEVQYVLYAPGFNNSATELNKWLASIGGLEVIYSEETPELIDISSMTIDNYIEVEPNGLVVFENDYNINVTNTIEYQVKVGE